MTTIEIQEDEKNNPMIELWDDRIKKILTN